MGLAFQNLSSTKSLPFWQALANNGQLSSPEMSFALGRDLHPKSQNVLVREGVFTLGGTNSTLFSGDIQFTDIEQPAFFWTLTLSGKCPV
jgi:cathepsin D